MKQSLYIFLLGIFMATQPLAAQEDNSELRQIYAQAETHYQIGQLEQATQLLKPHLASFSGGLKQNAYRLMALCYLANDNDVEAEKNAQLLLNENPYYTSMQDPPRFEDLINRLKSGRNATITTASKLAESVEDAPVPVTLITEDMIRMGTARNLLELLADYVPGVNIVEGEEANFAMRGIYSYSQENVLIMVDGIRMNSYCTNSVSPDYRISLENIKQIEILRGAASSLYGNVALTAVVNVITKSGADVNGLKVKAGLGNTHTSKADILWGKKTIDTDFLLWGSIYNSRGSRHDIKATDPVDGYGLIPVDGSIYVNGYNHAPSYDIGLKYRWKHLDLHLSHKYGKRNYVYTNIFIPTTYSYDKYEAINSVKPGRGVSSTNASIRYSTTFKNLSFDAGLNMNYESSNLYNVCGDTLSPITQQDLSLTAMFPWKDDENTGGFPILTSGVFQTQSWKNMNTCVDMKVVYEYSTKSHGNGSILIGGQFDYFDMYYNDMKLGDKYGRIYLETVNERALIFKNNHEQNMSAFIQLKHDFKNNFILNTGARYDFRDRYTNKKIKQFSPRVAIIWTPTKHMNYKLSYARSFVDAPYFYRASKVVYDGNENLDAQFMDNYQLSAIYSFPELHLKYETCVFYNYVMDVITLINTGYMNSGTIKNIGWENVIEYQRPGFKAIATTYLQHAINGHKTTYDASESIDYINSIPNFTAHLQLQKSLTKKLWFVAKGSFNSKQTMYYTSEMVLKYNSTDYLCGTEYHIPSCFLLDLGTKYSNGNWDFSLNCQNVFNHKYRLGGDRVPVLQQGRIILGTVSVCIK